MGGAERFLSLTNAGHLGRPRGLARNSEPDEPANGAREL
jgi:hypothetical protein